MVERCSDKAEVGGSIPPSPTTLIYNGKSLGPVAQFGRAPALHAGGCRFKSDPVHNKNLDKIIKIDYFK